MVQHWCLPIPHHSCGKHIHEYQVATSHLSILGKRELGLLGDQLTPWDGEKLGWSLSYSECQKIRKLLKNARVILQGQRR